MLVRSMFYTLLLLFLAPAVAASQVFPVDKAKVPMGRLIVFIHGIGGDAEGTFTNKKTGAYWPKLLGTDGDIFEGADIYSYEYESNIIGKGRGIDWLADEMAQNLESKIQISSYQSVVFVAHSLGGLVLRKYLLDENRAPNHGILAENRVKGIILFGVPTNGSTKADIAKVTGVSRLCCTNRLRAGVPPSPNGLIL